MLKNYKQSKLEFNWQLELLQIVWQLHVNKCRQIKTLLLLKISLNWMKWRKNEPHILSLEEKMTTMRHGSPAEERPHGNQEQNRNIISSRLLPSPLGPGARTWAPKFTGKPRPWAHDLPNWDNSAKRSKVSRQIAQIEQQQCTDVFYTFVKDGQGIRNVEKMTVDMMVVMDRFQVGKSLRSRVELEE